MNPPTALYLQTPSNGAPYVAAYEQHNRPPLASVHQPDRHHDLPPTRLAYSRWLTQWVLKLDPNACDELLILARGKTCAPHV
jgi:hypothetical protein